MISQTESKRASSQPQSTGGDRQQELLSTISWLSENGYPALPVAPAQDPYQYPRRDPEGRILTGPDGLPLAAFTGKNPSFVDRRGVPHLVRHNQYQEQLPSKQTLDAWFANPINGIGVLGGWNGTVWLDFDAKRFSSSEACQLAVEHWLRSHALEQTFIERTQSGGYRVAVKCQNFPSFTNFAMHRDGDLVGEALGHGRFAVLAPTRGIDNRVYTSISRAFPVEVESLESIGIYPASAQPQQKRQVPMKPPTREIRQIRLFGHENLLDSPFFLQLLQSAWIEGQALLQWRCVRIHSRLIYGKRKDLQHLKLWYLLRGLDLEGTGHAIINIETALYLLNRSMPTLYLWRREGLASGSFRAFEFDHMSNTMEVWLGSKEEVANHLNLPDWGATSEEPLLVVRRLKTSAIEAELQNQQTKSDYAARKAIPKNQKRRKQYTPESLLDEALKIQRGTSGEPCQKDSEIVHASEHTLFMSSSFVPFGATQQTTGDLLNLSDRTIRRHSNHLVKRQIVQAKAPYHQLFRGIQSKGNERNWAVIANPYTYIVGDRDSMVLYERNGSTDAAREGGHPITEGQFFSYFGAVWINRPNIYRLSHRLKLEAASRESYKLNKSFKIGAAENATISKPYESEASTEDQAGIFVPPES